MFKFLGNSNILILIIFCVSVFASACGDKSVNPRLEEVVFIPDSLVALDINKFHVNINRNGTLSEGRIFVDGISDLGVIYSAGLWLATNQAGEVKANITWFLESNYTVKKGDDYFGVFSITQDNVQEIAPYWPVDQGAPVNADGTPVSYGDAMSWASFFADTTQTESILSNPIVGLRVNQMVYAYQRSDIEQVIFIRYEITNLNSVNLDEIYCGFWSDTDLYPGVNSTGYDSLRALTYTYSPQDTLYNGEIIQPSGLVTGFTYLEVPESHSFPFGVTSHRVMRKNNYYNPEFGEHGFDTPEQVLYALKGLDNSGQPMINPTTDLPTKYAFTGDPVNKTGWLDVKVDVRSMLSSGPFPLASGETKVIAVVWIVEEGNTFAEGLQQLKDKVNRIRAEQSLWLF